MSCVSIGLCKGGKPVLGVVYDPYQDEMFMAVEGVRMFVTLSFSLSFSLLVEENQTLLLR